MALLFCFLFLVSVLCLLFLASLFLYSGDKMSALEFEKPIFELESRIKELQIFSSSKKIALEPELKKLTQKLDKMKLDIYNSLTSWQRIQIARHPQRPFTLDYIRMITSDFVELHGDRQFADDMAIVAGLAQINGTKVMLMGHQKGRDTKENVMRNFGCAHPEGYRKAMRLMQLAEKFGLPLVIFIDTPGAYPGVGAEERGQAHAIAENLRDMVELRTPIVATIIGEGGSGGALGIGIADRVCIFAARLLFCYFPGGLRFYPLAECQQSPSGRRSAQDYGGEFARIRRC